MEASKQNMQYGISTEPRTPKSFRGRGGIWSCENCSTTILLPKGSKKWTCEKCQKVQWTTPISECPLEKARRFIQNKCQEFESTNAEEEKEKQQDSKGATTEKAAESISAPEPAPAPAPFPISTA